MIDAEAIFDVAAAFFVLAGILFMLVGAVGIVRFPDAYNRLHASSKCSTLGLLGLLLGAVCHIGTLAVATKAVLTILFAFVATPVGSHILAKAAHIDRLRQWSRTLSDELAEDEASGRGRSLRAGDAEGNGEAPGAGAGGGGATAQTVVSDRNNSDDPPKQQQGAQQHQATKGERKQGPSSDDPTQRAMTRVTG